jgi:hypothetical protein
MFYLHKFESLLQDFRENRESSVIFLFVKIKLFRRFSQQLININEILRNFTFLRKCKKLFPFPPWIARGVAKELVGEKLYVYGVVCIAAAEKNSIIKIDRRWLCRGFGQGPKLVSVSHRNICTNIQRIKREILYI